MAKEKDGAVAEPALNGLTQEQLQALLAAGASFDHIVQLTANGFGYEHILRLAPSLKAPQGGGGLTAADLKTLLDGQRKAMRPENEQHPGISAFSHPDGEQAHPKDTLRRPTFFNGMREHEDCLTPIEIELYNRFDKTMTARDGRWKADVRQNGSAQELHITTVEIGSLDGRLSLPQLTLILRELLDGAEAANPDALAARVVALEATIKEMQAQKAA